MQAQAREIEAQGRAINLQESSAIMLDRAHRPGRSRNAGPRARPGGPGSRDAVASASGARAVPERGLSRNG